MTNSQLIHKFYDSFSEGNAQKMGECYHPEVTFEDEAFGRLKGEKAKQMWQMLLSNKSAAPQVTYTNLTEDGNSISVDWKAEYLFGPKKRKVINEVKATLTIVDGKIITHTDSFDFWKWSRQALGPVGTLLGWTPFLKKKVQSNTSQMLHAYIKKQG